ncbi:hypothetical protein ILUMI_25147 [Ignelater luminosus]|uniref:PiggyBac transposable element-derived protein domain-containing protein n=1 Tax=Ignelater luminosus TaxID=2038154 RepID=A0A8K0C7V9_IGNLU|nr:hypothetical protein ILUMI_25147 [Ignelater luminosus]
MKHIALNFTAKDNLRRPNEIYRRLLADWDNHTRSPDRHKNSERIIREISGDSEDSVLSDDEDGASSFRNAATVDDEEDCSSDDEIPLSDSIFRYCSEKPKKWGYKLWVLSEFFYDFELFTGLVNTAETEVNFGAASNVVVRMSRQIPEQVYHKLYFDNYFTSLSLVPYLLKRGIDCIVTARVNRVSNGKFPTEKVFKSKGRDWCVEKETEYDGVSIKAIQWLDNKVITLVSNYAGSEPKHQVRQFFRTEKKTKCMSYTDIVKIYNGHMGGVDLLESRIALYHIQLRKKKWYHRLFFHMLDVAICNSWIIFRRIAKCHDEFRETSLYDFKLEVAKSLANAGHKFKKKRSTYEWF